jgi:hypothetical protein
MSAKQRTKSAIIVQHQAFLFLWYRRYRTNGTDTLVLYRRDREKGRFGTVGLDGWLVRLCGQRTLFKQALIPVIFGDLTVDIGKRWTLRLAAIVTNLILVWNYKVKRLEINSRGSNSK